mmetsp:Transcript_21038/g.37751  ORF Transcript_21038/g.37751 Transcript_21038/m.37751 type:complete len:328 (-) Transcript_21038:16-999(-)|eukprot:CAMPEP_0201603422 /NCGR_PEP_ID=MMETSP0492-20130828/3864_1 /ASSEMBLY_ACC=CAM_ASM_000837 /TAXON_ID=420259 /ORGANISM="Thalassiosira gravida, Strain GMp14c1" /LENGTH=327 /DNA_ID=CAMNT_0048067195 /DNA_START=42 /DNA_END=1025 /DNA_ORIENTATION=-
MTDSSAPFSFECFEDKVESAAITPPVTIRATDDIDISISVYLPTETTARLKAALIFYHGGGAHSRAGYSDLGQGIASHNDMAVYMPDLRGHGASGGPRGDAPSSEQVLRDITSVIEYVRAKVNGNELKKNNVADEGGVPIFLGGHSSGGGLVINYATWTKRIIEPNLVGYVLVAPQLGYKSQTSRPKNHGGRAEFATVRILPFILNGIFNTCGHSKAVQFNYPPSIIETHGVVAYNTVNMANAITPETPGEQMGNIDLPVGMWIGSEDELFVPEQVVEYLELLPTAPAKQSHGEIIEGSTHLGVLVNVHLLSSIGHWLAGLVQNEAV